MISLEALLVAVLSSSGSFLLSEALSAWVPEVSCSSGFLSRGLNDFSVLK